MNSAGDNPRLAFETQGAKTNRNPERAQARIERISSGLARYAVRLANQGHLNENFLASSGILGHKSFIKRHPEVYDIANQQLAEESLYVERMGLSDSQGLAIWFENDVIRVQMAEVQTEEQQPRPSDRQLKIRER